MDHPPQHAHRGVRPTEVCALRARRATRRPTRVSSAHAPLTAWQESMCVASTQPRLPRRHRSTSLPCPGDSTARRLCGRCRAPAMWAPWCRWLAVAGAVLVLLATRPRPAAAVSPVPVPDGAPSGTALGRGRRVNGGGGRAGSLSTAASRRVRATEAAGSYSLFGGQVRDAKGCPGTLTLSSPERVADAEAMELLRFPGESITRDGTRCAGGSLLVIRTLGLLNPDYAKSRELGNVILRVNRTVLMRNWLEWSDSVGLITNSWACGSVPRWNSTTTYMLFGDDGWRINGLVQSAAVVLEDGRPHMMIINNGVIMCILRAPTPPAETPVPSEERSTPPAGGSDGLVGGGGLSAGPVAGVAVGSAAAAAVVVAGAVALGCRRSAGTRNSGNSRGGGGGVGGGSNGGDGNSGGNGGGGAPPTGVSAGTPAEAPWLQAARPSAEESAAKPSLAMGGARYPPYAPPTAPAPQPAAAVPRGPPVDTPGPAPSLPTGLLYSWEVVTPSGSDALGGGR